MYIKKSGAPQIKRSGMGIKMGMKKLIRRKLSTTQLITLGFLMAIITGALLLMLPCSSADGTVTPFVDCLFTSATSVCVTGLVVVTTATHWSFFGKLVILGLIQLGGLGIISFTTGLMMILRKRITLRDRVLLEDSLNLDTLKGLVRFLKRIFKGTFVVEGIGALCYSFLFIPMFVERSGSAEGILRGIWYSVFHSVSAFCNAGIDLFGDSGVMPFAKNPWFNIVTMLLIILGGLGFIVWWDVIENGKKAVRGGYPLRKLFKRLRLHSKITLVTTASLILMGAGFFFCLEYTNPDTIGSFTFPQKIMASFFQSVTLRTAGFSTFSQSGLRVGSVVVCLFLMLIGGSSISTAGGIKTSTFAALFLSTRMTIQGKDHLVVFNRNIPHKTVQKALAVSMVSILVFIAAVFALYMTEGGHMTDAAFETASAIATVGLSRDYTSRLHLAGKLIITLCMYLGRIGPISLAIFFERKRHGEVIRYAREDITVG